MFIKYQPHQDVSTVAVVSGVDVLCSSRGLRPEHRNSHKSFEGYSTLYNSIKRMSTVIRLSADILNYCTHLKNQWLLATTKAYRRPAPFCDFGEIISRTVTHL